MTDDRVTPLTDHRLDRIVDMLNEAIDSRLLTGETKLLEIDRWARKYTAAIEDWVGARAACPRCGDPGYRDVLDNRYCGNVDCEYTGELGVDERAGTEEEQ